MSNDNEARISVSVSLQEREDFHKAAKALGTRVTDICRKALKDAAYEVAQRDAVLKSLSLEEIRPAIDRGDIKAPVNDAPGIDSPDGFWDGARVEKERESDDG